MTRIRSALLIGGLIVLLGAAPVSAAELPDASHVATADRVGTGAYLVNPETGELTLLGGDSSNILDWDVDDSGKGYAVGYSFEGDELASSSIWTIDLAAGTISAPRDLLQGDLIAACTSFDYTGGVLLANCVVQLESSVESSFGTINPDTGQYTPSWVYSGTTESATALAVDATTGETYFFFQLTGDGAPRNVLFRLNLAEQSFEEVAEVGGYLLGADFDSNGILWASVANDLEFPLDDMSLASIDVETGATDIVGPLELTDSEQPGEFWALTVWGAAPALAATGVDATIPLWFAVLAIAAGAIALSFRRRPRMQV